MSPALPIESNRHASAFLLAFQLLVLLSPWGAAQVTVRVSVSSSGAQGNGPSANPGISADGRYVVFRTDSPFVPEDTNFLGGADVYRHDNLTGATELVSWNAANTAQGGGGTGTGGAPSITADGRYVVFESPTSNLVLNDTNGGWDVFVRDMQQHTTSRASVASGGAQVSGHSWTWHNAISDDARYVVFFSTNPNIDPSYAPPPAAGIPTYTLYVHDSMSNTTRCVGSNAFMNRHQAVISADGSRIAYQRFWDGPQEVWMSSPTSPQTETRVSQTSGFGAGSPSISSDGRLIAFYLANGIFVRNTQTGTLAFDAGEAAYWNGNAIISGDGTKLAFISTMLLPGACGTPGNFNLFVKEIGAPTISASAVSVGLGGCMTGGAQDLPTISRDGRMIAYGNASGSLVSGDTNGILDVFLNDRSNIPPVADAGQDQSVDELVPVTLDGSASHDADSPVLSYTWTQIAGTAVVLATTDPVRPTFTTPSVELGGDTLTFMLKVDDGEKFATDVVNVLVKNVNHAPIAIAEPVLPVLEGSLVTLDGSQTWDPDNDTLSYQWIGPSGITIADDGAVTTWFVAPEVGQVGQDLSFTLLVSDGLELAFDSTTVRVENIDHAPVAVAGVDQTRDEGTTIYLDGNASFDPDSGDVLSPSWIQLAGPSVTLSDPLAWAPSFLAPLGSGGQDVSFALVVYDGVLYSAPSFVTIHILSIDAPPDCSNAVASLSTLWAPDHKLVPVSILGVSDPDGDSVVIEITGVTQDEPVAGSGQGDTGPDAVLVDGKLLLRAERSAGGDGRVYEIHFTARDGYGAECAGTVRVAVPKNKKQDAPVDSGQSYSSFGT